MPFKLKDFYDFTPCSLTAEYAGAGFKISLAYQREGDRCYTVTLLLDSGGVYEVSFDEPITIVTRAGS